MDAARWHTAGPISQPLVARLAPFCCQILSSDRRRGAFVCRRCCRAAEIHQSTCRAHRQDDGCQCQRCSAVPHGPEIPIGVMGRNCRALEPYRRRHPGDGSRRDAAHADSRYGCRCRVRNSTIALADIFDTFESFLSDRDRRILLCGQSDSTPAATLPGKCTPTRDAAEEKCTTARVGDITNSTRTTRP